MNELITKVSSRITHGNTIISLQTSKKTITISINTSIGFPLIVDRADMLKGNKFEGVSVGVTPSYDTYNYQVAVCMLDPYANTHNVVIFATNENITVDYNIQDNNSTESAHTTETPIEDMTAFDYNTKKFHGMLAYKKIYNGIDHDLYGISMGDDTGYTICFYRVGSNITSQVTGMIRKDVFIPSLDLDDRAKYSNSLIDNLYALQVFGESYYDKDNTHIHVLFNNSACIKACLDEATSKPIRKVIKAIKQSYQQ